MEDQTSDSNVSKPNDYLRSRIFSIPTVASVNGKDEPDSRTELDSHANVVVLGRHCLVFDKVEGKHCDVQPFDPSIGKAKSVPIVDGAVAYDCPYTHRSYILIARNALYIPTMPNNLVPPFILREAGVIVSDTPKIHIKSPSKDDHSILFTDENLRVPLQLIGVFSFFHTRIPTEEEISSCPKLFMTPDSHNWDPYSSHFAENEESMLDWEGEMVEHPQRSSHMLDKYPDPPDAGVHSAQVDHVLASAFAALNLDSESASAFISAAQIDAHHFSQDLAANAEYGKFAMAIGCTDANVNSDDFLSFDPIYYDVDFSNPSFEIYSVTGSKPKAVSADFLSKIWNIDHNLAKKTIKQTTQLCRRGEHNDLSRHYSTNDRMLRYKRIQSQFFSDTFFVAKDAKSTRGYTCAQIFVSDKGFVAIYPMKSKGDFIHALKLFCKEIGVPLSVVVDPSGEQTSSLVKHFCHQVGTTLRILEAATQWADRAELYVGMFKEATRKDLRVSNCPMVLWDYCIERRARIHNVAPRDLFQLNGNNPITATLGEQGDISNICTFAWYDWCYYREDRNVSFPHQKEKLGRVLGPMKNEGNKMCQAVLTSSALVVPRRTVRRLTVAELNSESEQKKRKIFDDIITDKLGDSMSLPPCKT